MDNWRYVFAMKTFTRRTWVIQVASSSTNRPIHREGLVFATITLLVIRLFVGYPGKRFADLTIL